MNPQQYRVRDVTDRRQPTVSQYQAPDLGPERLLIEALRESLVAVLPRRREND
jgi:hypothetical protein